MNRVVRLILICSAGALLASSLGMAQSVQSFIVVGGGTATITSGAATVGTLGVGVDWALVPPVALSGEISLVDGLAASAAGVTLRLQEARFQRAVPFITLAAGYLTEEAKVACRAYGAGALLWLTTATAVRVEYRYIETTERGTSERYNIVRAGVAWRW